LHAGFEIGVGMSVGAPISVYVETSVGSSKSACGLSEILIIKSQQGA
jgi:hypothetical protein